MAQQNSRGLQIKGDKCALNNQNSEKIEWTDAMRMRSKCKKSNRKIAPKCYKLQRKHTTYDMEMEQKHFLNKYNAEHLNSYSH